MVSCDMEKGGVGGSIACLPCYHEPEGSRLILYCQLDEDSLAPDYW